MFLPSGCHEFRIKHLREGTTTDHLTDDCQDEGAIEGGSVVAQLPAVYHARAVTRLALGILRWLDLLIL
jgi:hypothetical protein